MAVQLLGVDTNEIITAKQQHLREREEKTPGAAVIALADMQTRPQPVLNVVTGGQSVTVIGQVTYAETYDPVAAALRYIRAGVDAVALYTDQQVYRQGLNDLLLLARGSKHPVISKDYILDEYHVAEARAAGAAALTLYASVLDPVMLRRTVSIAQRWGMTAILQIEDESQLPYVYDLSPHAVAVGSPFDDDLERNFDRLAELRHQLPHNTQVLLLDCLPSLDYVTTALELKVDALVVDERLLAKPSIAGKLYALIERTIL